MADFRRRRYLLMTIDPVHIGTGGYRLGRVDNSIVREPGTRVPKIPGTSLSGAIRHYTASRAGRSSCAGQKGHCGKPTCPICYTFGYVRENNDHDAFSGIVSLFDALVVLFPVYSAAGPVWATTWQRLREAGFTLPERHAEPPADGALFTWDRSDPLNLGWLVLSGHKIESPSAPEVWHSPRWDAVKERIVILPEALFAHVVNSNLEVRTSVSINPVTGAAEKGALFTYEAIPRSTFLTMEVVQDDYRGAFPADNSLGWSTPLEVVQGGMELAEWLGVGGMGTRGFGRVAMVGTAVEETIEGASNA